MISKIGKVKLVFVYSLLVLLFGCNPDEPLTKVVERGTVVDVDGNVYKTVKIGEQWWMAENLRVTRFNDGSSLAFVTVESADSIWSNSNTPTYTSIYDAQYGLLYNYQVVEASQNIAPEGWHVPTDEDRKILESEIGMPASELNATGWRGTQEATLLTAKNSSGWPEGDPLFGTDDYEFNAKPGGCRVFSGETNYFGNVAFWWTKSVEGNEGWYRYFDSNQTQIFRQHTYKGYGMSIRCVKNN